MKNIPKNDLVFLYIVSKLFYWVIILEKKSLKTFLLKVLVLLKNFF